jgi:hypothetical protein
MDDGKNLSTENNNSLKAQLGDNMADIDKARMPGHDNFRLSRIW